MQGSARDPAQEALVERMKAVLVALRLSPQEAEGRINEMVGQPEGTTFISWASITNYREGRWKRLTQRMFRDLERAVEELESLVHSKPPEAAPGWDEGYRAAVRDMEEVLARLKAPTAPPSDDDVAVAEAGDDPPGGQGLPGPKRVGA